MYRFVGILIFTLSCLLRFGENKAIVAKPYCELSDRAMRFNFTRLSETTDDRVIVNEKFGETIRLRLCAPLHEPCNGMHHYSICLTIGNADEKGIGKAPPDSVVASSGQLKFHFTGDPCDRDKSYSVEIIMKCNNEAGYDSQPKLLPRRSDRCTFHMVWQTKAACGKEHTVECKATDELQRHYDLGSLTLRSENYIVPLSDTSDSAVLLNICHNVVYDYNATCLPNSGACLRKFDTEGKKTVYKNLGIVTKPPYFDNGVLTLKYESGEICISVQDKLVVETIILFQCDHRATNTLPEYEGGAEECLHRFRWKTAAACAIELTKNHSDITANSCKVTDPVTNIEYNFQELMFKDFRSESPKGTVYTFQICGSISDINFCQSGTGACDMKNNISMGSANTNLMWNQGGPYLNYTDGAECGKSNQRWYTLIAFFCGAEGSATVPIVMEDEDCALIIYWNTPLLCDRRIKCQTKYGRMSLMPLIRWNDNYVVKAKDKEFNINVCRPLIPKPYLTCLHGSAACHVVPESNAQFVNETSLGYPDENPLIDEEKHVILRYTGGSVCPEDKRNTLSSNLTFLCNHSSAIGSPEYKYYRNCTHVFEWATSVVCENTEGRLTTGCIIENPRLSRIINLTSLHEKPVYSVKSQFGDRYNVSLCDESSYCNGSAVCKGDNGYGTFSSVIFDYAQSAIILKSSNGTRCKTDFYTSEVRLVCDESAGNGEPKLLEVQSSEISCSVAFEWKTKVVCETSEMSSEPNVKETLAIVEESARGQVGQNIGIGIIVICSIALVIYLWNAERRARLRSCFNCLTTRREECRVQYSKLNANEEARLMLNPRDKISCQIHNRTVTMSY